MRKTRRLLALLASTLALQAQAEIQLLPAGEFQARDGRPGPGKAWRLSDEDGQRLAAELTAVAHRSAFVIDYEHQSLRAAENGQPAPAAAFATRFEWRTGQGLYALDATWTDRARGHIEAGEYRYISPVILFDPDGRITGVLNAALVNTPALLGMEPVARELQAQLAAQFEGDDNPHQENHVDLLQALIAALGLQPTTDQAAALQAVTALRTRAETPPLPQQLAAALQIKPDADLQAALGAVEALRRNDPTTLSTIQALQGQVAELSARLQGSEVEQLVDQALTDHKLLPAMKDWAIGLGKKNLADLKAYLASAPKLELGSQSGGGNGGQGAGNTAALSAQGNEILQQMGLTPKQYEEHLAKTKAAA